MPTKPLRSLIFVALFLAGLALGRLSALPTQAPPPTRPSLSFANDEPDATCPPAEASQSAAAAPAATPPAQESETANESPRSRWEEWADDPRAALARRAFEHSPAPEQAADFVIDHLSDDELIDLIAGVTNFTPNDVAAERDPRELARRLASIAMDGVVRDSAPSPADGESVQFATRVTADNLPEQPTQDFDAGARRIYAVFPNDGYRGEEVVVKWYRTDRRELLMLRKHPIVPEDGQSYVWLEPNDGWAPGEYGVEFYSSTGGIQKLAEGRYRVH